MIYSGGIFQPSSLSFLWNDLVQTRELTSDSDDAKHTINSEGHASKKGENSKHYCGKRVLTCHCCNGVCEEPGCNCTACAQLDASQEEVMSQHKHSEQVISSWTWKQSVPYSPPVAGMSDLKLGAELLLQENMKIGKQVAVCTLSTSILVQRLMILKRYMVALARHRQPSNKISLAKYKSTVTASNISTQKSKEGV
ncbi:hypothetical protein EB796_003998 [Bugula neritina]|uniref:Uncharacterized protein n=1 Tax=Bugula neritina TaxID=10212 RepID=A0A7J7KGA1_BUGNE|nr:hypothetical protein EB796_003998 [Bugula neritina]